MELALRPTFVIHLPEPAESIALRLHEHLTDPDIETRWSRVPGASCDTARERTHVLVTLVESRRKFWSPWLHVDVRDCDGKTELFGRYSPHPNVWTAFALGYLLLSAIIFLASLFACAQTLLNAHSDAWWVVVFSVLAAASMWWSAQLGKRIANEQMRELDTRFRSALSGLGKSNIENQPDAKPV